MATWFKRRFQCSRSLDFQSLTYKVASTTRGYFYCNFLCPSLLEVAKILYTLTCAFKIDLCTLTNFMSSERNPYNSYISPEPTVPFAKPVYQTSTLLTRCPGSREIIQHPRYVPLNTILTPLTKFYFFHETVSSHPACYCLLTRLRQPFGQNRLAFSGPVRTPRI